MRVSLCFVFVFGLVFVIRVSAWRGVVAGCGRYHARVAKQIYNILFKK